MSRQPSSPRPLAAHALSRAGCARVRPQMELKAFKERFGIVKMVGKAYVDGKIALEGEFTFALVKAK
jgi:3-hydroxymyristoyl/3-hydroxydecanoyl-(acyl carrier protein) dehydratase